MSDDLIDNSTLDSLREQLSGQEEVLQRVMRIYLDELPGRLADIRAGVDSGDAQAMRDAAHSLRGSSATLGAARVAELTTELEHLGRENDLAPAPELVKQLDEAAAGTAKAFEAQLAGP